MVTLDWKVLGNIGVPLIDVDHQQILAAIHRLNGEILSEHGDAAIRSGLARLVDDVESHFSREELVLRKGGYPDLDRHRAQHVRLKESLARLTDHYERGGNRALTAELLVFLGIWFSRHVQVEDRTCAPWMAGARTTRDALAACHAPSPIAVALALPA